MNLGRFALGTLAFGTLTTAVATGCGSRSGLLSDTSSSGSAGTHADSGPGGAGGSGGTGLGASGGVGGLGASGGLGGSSGVAGTGGAPFECPALEAGPATVVLSFPDRHATAPSAVLLENLSPPRIALQAFATGGSSTAHDDIQLARYEVDPGAPAGIKLELQPMLVGVESHGWGNLVVAPGGLPALALAWHGDPGGLGRPMFRSVDAASWTPGSIVDLTQGGAGDAVTLPQKWSIGALAVRQGSTTCVGYPWAPGGVMAVSASGSIDWPGSSSVQFPCALDLSFSATFAPTAPWIPLSEAFSANQVLVKGGPCGG